MARISMGVSLEYDHERCKLSRRLVMLVASLVVVVVRMVFVGSTRLVIVSPADVLFVGHDDDSHETIENLTTSCVRLMILIRTSCSSPNIVTLNNFSSHLTFLSKQIAP